MNTKDMSIVNNPDKFDLYMQNNYISPQIDICETVVEKGFSLSFTSGSEGGISTGTDYGWDDELEF